MEACDSAPRLQGSVWPGRELTACGQVDAVLGLEPCHLLEQMIQSPDAPVGAASQAGAHAPAVEAAQRDAEDRRVWQLVPCALDGGLADGLL